MIAASFFLLQFFLLSYFGYGLVAKVALHENKIIYLGKVTSFVLDYNAADGLTEATGGVMCSDPSIQESKMAIYIQRCPC